MSKKKKTAEQIETTIWLKYRAGVENHRLHNLFASTERNYRFYEGDQWFGVPKSENLPTANFIKPTVNYKVSMVAMNTMQIVYSPLDYSEESIAVCDVLNKYAAQKWERLKLDSLSWDVILNAAVAGDSYLYFYNKNLDCQIIRNTDIFFANEQERDIQKQEYIIVQERRPVNEIRRIAKENDIPEEDIENIVGDSDTDSIIGDTEEVRSADESNRKCMCLLYLGRNDDGDIVVCRSTKYTVYQKETVLKGLKRYPIASFVWGPMLNSARGTGEVKPLISNQFETNKLLARRCRSAAQNAFAKPVYMKNQVENPEDIGALGTAIALRGNGTPQDIKQIFDYIAPAPMSQEASLLQSDLITTSRELAGAGNAALGQINPSRASGDAIMAVVDQSAIPMNMQTAAYRQFVEDVALIFFAYWRVYATDEGLSVSYIVNDEITNGRLIVKKVLTRDQITTTDVGVKIDATATNPYSKLAEEQSIEVARNAGYISFEEYVEALPYNSIAPKSRYEEIIKKRNRNAAAAPEAPVDTPMKAQGTTLSKASGMKTAQLPHNSTL